MYYYKQTNRQTGEVIAFLTCSSELKDNDEEIKLDELMEEEYAQAVLEMYEAGEAEMQEEAEEPVEEESE